MIIDLQKYKAEKEFDRHKDPCSECNIKNCDYTCDKAEIWWRTLANKLKGK